MLLFLVFHCRYNIRRIKKLIVVISLVLCGHSLVKAQQTFDYTATCQQAYKEIIQLKLGNGIKLLNKAKQENPNNLIPLVLESYGDFFELFLNEDPTVYAQKKPLFEERIKLLRKGPDSSPLKNFSLCAIYIQKAAVEIKFGEWFSAGWDSRRAYQLIKENKKKFPAFTPNNLLYGTLETVVGTIPKSYQWIASLFGMKGSVNDGIATVNVFVKGKDNWSSLLHNEASFIYCYLLFYFDNKKDESLAFITANKLDVVNNHLFTYMASNLAINNKQPDYAASIILNRNQSPEYFQTGIWNYTLGFASLYHLNTKAAIQYLEQYLANFKGKFYVKDIYQKISWAYYLQGDLKAAQLARKNVLTKGNTNSDSDKQALAEAKKGGWPNAVLLKARLLNDGGYNKEALELLGNKTITFFTTEADQLEFVYRMGRINDDLKYNTAAIQYYLQAIAKGAHRSEYYGARAALQTGMLYEKMGDKPNAIKYYTICLDMDNHDYKNSLDQRAKTGIIRCNGN